MAAATPVRPLRPIQSERKAASFGDIAAEVAALEAEASVDERAQSCMVHMVEQLYHGNGWALGLCAFFLGLGILSFSMGLSALAMNQFLLGNVLKEQPPVESAACW